MNTYQIMMPNGSVYRVEGNEIDLRENDNSFIRNEGHLVAIVPKEALVINIEYLQRLSINYGQKEDVPP